MDPSSMQQYQNQSQPYDSSSSAAAYYPTYHHQYGGNNYQYYPQDYSNYQQHPHPEESSSLHPPGVPIDSQPQYSGHDHYYAAYHHQHQHQQQQQQYDAATWQGGGVGTDTAHVAARPSQYDPGMWHDGGAVPEAGHVRPRLPVGPSYSGGRREGRGGGSSFRGRGRGRGRGGPTPGAPPQQSAPPPRMAWCELCRADCNTAEILQKHLEGKKHKKNIKMKEELERLNKIIVERENEKVEEQKTGANKQQVVSEMSASRGRGSKRKMRGGRGGNKMMRTSEGSKREVEPPNQKQTAVPFFCELCRVTCESQVVFDSHLRGRKHMANLHEQQTLLGHAALEALYPALQAILPSLQGNYSSNSEGSNISSLAPQFQQDGQDTQAILTQLLTTLLTTGQVGVTPGAASTSASVPPLVTENLNPENLPEGGSQGAGNVASKSEMQPESVNVALAAVTTEKKDETIESEGGDQGAADVAAKSETQSELANTAVVAAVITEKKFETIESEIEKVDAQPALKP